MMKTSGSAFACGKQEVVSSAARPKASLNLITPLFAEAHPANAHISTIDENNRTASPPCKCRRRAAHLNDVAAVKGRGMAGERESARMTAGQRLRRHGRSNSKWREN